jgi:AbrB family looped-hinge helix DNA binding protein
VAKVTSKLQVTVPKSVASRYALRPGDELVFEPAGDVIRLVPPGRATPLADMEARIRLFDQATDRQRARQRRRKARRPPAGRGWTRDELYERGRAR